VGRHLDATANFLRSLGFKFEVDEEKDLIYMPFSGENGRWAAVLDVKEDRGILIMYSMVSVKIQEKARPAVAEFLTRANYNMILGNFELDFSDGEVRFKTSVKVGDGALAANLIEPVVFANLATMDRYLPGIMAVGFGGQSPEAAIKEIEGS